MPGPRTVDRALYLRVQSLIDSGESDPVSAFTEVSDIARARTTKSARQSTAASMPTYRVVDGVDALKFDGSDDSLTLDEEIAAPPCSIYVVAKPADSLNEAFALVGGDSGALAFVISERKQMAYVTSGVHILTGNANVSTTKFSLFCLTIDAEGDVSLFLDGVADGTGTTAEPIPFAAPLKYIGLEVAEGGPTSFFRDYIRAVLIYNEAHDADTRAAVEAALVRDGLSY